MGKLSLFHAAILSAAANKHAWHVMLLLLLQQQCAAAHLG
jgi:hypothetical protein